MADQKRRGATVEGTMAAAIEELREQLESSIKEIALVVGQPGTKPPGRPAGPKVELPGLSDELRDLAKKPRHVPVLESKASRRADGRRIPLALVVVRDAQGRTRPGVPVHLRDGDTILDRGTTGVTGAVLLRFPRRKNVDQPARATVHVVGHAERDVEVPVKRQIVTVDLEVDPLPEVPVPGGLDEAALAKAVDDALQQALGSAGPATNGGAADGEAAEGEAGGAAGSIQSLSAVASSAAVAALSKQLQSFFAGSGGGDLFNRLPTDFTTDVCEAIAKIAGDEPDPLLTGSLLASRPDPLLGALSGPSSALTRRTTTVRRTTVMRLAPPDNSAVSPTGKEPALYLCRVRQRWVFAGYSLGELAEVEPLDPGAVLRDVTQLVSRATESTERAAEEQVRRTLSTVLSQLQRVSSVDNVVRVAASAHTAQRTQAITSVGTDPLATVAGGVIGAILAGPVGAIAGGVLGALAGGVEVGTGVETDLDVRSTVTTSTNLDTSLQVNQLTQNAASMVNQVVRTATAVATELERTTGRAVDRVSPLLSRVTNLLRWTIYENYIVCNEIEDVQRVFDVPLSNTLGNPAAPPIFTAQDVLDYRRLWEPRLLDRSLRGNFDAIRRAIDTRDTTRTVSRVTIRADYVAAGFHGLLRFNLGANEVALRLRPGDSTQTATLHLPATPIDQLDELSVTLTAVDPRPERSFLGITLPQAGLVRVRRLQLWFDRNTASQPEVDLGMDLGVSVDGGLATSAELAISLPEDTADPEADPLVKHVNRNRSHYLGLIAQAALTNPALRDDSRHLAAFGGSGSTGGDAAIWRLPIVGFEGARVLVLAPADEDDPFIEKLLLEDGAGTVVQLAAPGSYAEALQGLTELLDAKGLLHPQLLAPPSPLLMPAALVDAENQQLIPLGGGIVPIPGTANPQQPAGIAEGVITTPLNGVNVNGLPVGP